MITRLPSSGTHGARYRNHFAAVATRAIVGVCAAYCGVCTLGARHGFGDGRSKMPSRYPIPVNAQLIRNLMIGAQFVHDHVMHFYHSARARLGRCGLGAAEPTPRRLRLWRNRSPAMRAHRPATFRRCAEPAVKKLVESGQLGIFANAYWGHPGYLVAPRGEPDGGGALPGRTGVAASRWRRCTPFSAVRTRTRTLVVGGRPGCHQRARGVWHRVPLRSTKSDLQKIAEIIAQMREFVDQGVPARSTLAIASFYKDWFKPGHERGDRQFSDLWRFSRADGNRGREEFSGAP